MRVLISGASGFVGTNLKSYLSNLNFEILTINRNGGDYSWSDIFNYGIPQNVDTVIHLAGKAHDLKGISSADEYLSANTELTINFFEQFLFSDAEKFVYFSSVKACSDVVEGILDENQPCSPSTSYGISKLKAENSILSQFENYNQSIQNNKAKAKKYLYILRPCMIHGPGNKGNLTLLYELINRGIPYPLGLFNNRRSFLSIENLGFIINEILINPIESGIYQLADNDSISTSDLIKLMGQTRGVKPHILNAPKVFIITIARIGDLFRLPFNSHSLIKLTESYRVSNNKIVTAIGKPLPISLKDGLKLTFVSLMK